MKRTVSVFSRIARFIRYRPRIQAFYVPDNQWEKGFGIKFHPGGHDSWMHRVSIACSPFSLHIFIPNVKVDRGF